MTNKTRRKPRRKTRKHQHHKDQHHEHQHQQQPNTRTKTRRYQEHQQHQQPSIALLKNDYYTYVNLKWLKKTKLPNKYNIINEFSTLQQKIDKQIEKTVIPILLKDKNIESIK